MTLLDHWVKLLEDAGLRTSKWVLPTNGKGKISPAPYVVIQKSVDKITYSDDKPYTIDITVTLIAVMDVSDQITEKTIENLLWSENVGFEAGAETYDSTMNVHIREFDISVSYTYEEYLKNS